MADEIEQLLKRAASANLAELMSIWRVRVPEEWSVSPEIYRRLGERILSKGEPLLAYDVIGEGLTKWPEDVRLRQLQGLSLARSGATKRANAILEKLRQDGESDEETLGMLGRTFKDLAANAGTDRERAIFLRQAAEIYLEAYRNTGGYWTGINAATMALLTNETDRARELANEVRGQCLERIQESGDSYWELAVLGEAALILRDPGQAQVWYTRAATTSRKHYGDLHSTRRNARLILNHWKEDPGWINECLHVPSVIAFSGHMIDHPDRKIPRFSANLESAVANEISNRLEKLRPGFGFASASCGSDILFLEAMLERGAEISIVLPFNEEEFLRESVNFLPGSDWGARFKNVCDRAARVITASSQYLAIGGVSYEFCNDLILGLASIRANRLDTDLIPLVVWDGQPGDGPGGAASAVENWQRLGYEPEIIGLGPVAAVYDRRKSSADESPDDHRPPLQEFSSRIVALLFADAVGFSKLTEPEVPRFMQHFLGPIAELCKKFNGALLHKNTWGDGLYFVFNDVDQAGKFALELANLVATTKWEEKGLRPGLSLRIGLHAGPVYEFNDPITGLRSYSGTHVSRAARIEPITPPGQVYASESFAALSAPRRDSTFTCDYVGQTPMAKSYGTLPTYHVRSRGKME